MANNITGVEDNVKEVERRAPRSATKCVGSYFPELKWSSVFPRKPSGLLASLWFPMPVSTVRGKALHSLVKKIILSLGNTLNI